MCNNKKLGDKKMKEKIGVIGLGYIGLPLLAAFANAGFEVVGIDINQRKVDHLQRTYEADIYEPGLNEIIKRCKHKIEFTTDYDYLMRECDIIIITVGTPLSGGNMPNLNHINDAITFIGERLRMEQIIILKSTVFPGITRQSALKLEKISGLKAGTDFYVVFCPERTIEGAALHELHTLPKIIGGLNPESSNKAAAILGRLGGKVIKVSSPEAAEMCKLIDNAYRISCIAFANEIGCICEKIGIDAYEIASAVNETYARTNLFLPGLGGGGACLSKDPQMLTYYARKNDIDTKVIDSCIIKNLESTKRVVSVASQFIESNEIKKPKVSLIGLAFKGFPETDDVRNSPAIDIHKALQKKDKNITFGYYDPVVKNFLDRSVSQTIKECIKDSNVVVFLTDHHALMNIDTKYILNNSSRPLLIIDCWHNLINLDEIRDKNVQIFRIGDGRL